VSRKWLAVRDPRKLGFVRKAGLARVPIDTWLGPTPKGRSPITLDREKGRAAHTLYFRGEGGWSQGFPTGPVEAFQTFRASAEDWTPLVIDEKGRSVVMAAKKSTLFALSEPDLLNNQGIADLANAQAGLWIVDYVAKDRGSLVFDVTLNGFERSRSFLKTMFTPPFLAATLCGLAALMLIIWHGFFRFGRERAEEREFALGKRALADNQAALFKMVRREHRLGGRYAAIVRDLVARAVGAPRELSGEALDAFLDRMGAGGRTSWPLTTLAADLEKARTADDLVQAAGRLHHWRLEMTRERQ
jgi:hypothetical protein